MKELSIEEIHEGTLGILKKIIEICDEINVNYFLAYGSLIGAVRHGGFIPRMTTWISLCFDQIMKYLTSIV